MQGTGICRVSIAISLQQGLMALTHVSATQCGSAPALALASQQEQGVDH